MAEENPPITVRVTPAQRPILRRIAMLLKRSEGQILATGFEELAEMVKQRGEEKLPRLVHLIRAAEEYETSKPSLALQKLDKTLHSGYADGTLKVETTRQKKGKK